MRRTMPAMPTAAPPLMGVPPHVAIIMDGNGRWAAARGLPRLAGHRAGVENIRPILRECARLGVQYLTLYAFSTENWRRPPAEVDGLMRLMDEFIDREGRALHEEGARILHIGCLDGVASALQDRVRWLVDLTRDNSRITVAVAFNYGGRAELAAAARALVADGLRPEDVDEHALAERLFTRGLPDPDLVIRTSGESRLSNFLIWQAAYSEYWSTNVHWPDFGPDCLREAIQAFAVRERRFGGAPEPARSEPGQRARRESAEFGTVEQAASDVAAGRLVLIVDDEDRENEGDLMVATEHATPAVINFMCTHGRGLVCMPMLGERLDELGIPLMVPSARGHDGPAFTVSVDARGGGSGISAADRARTALALIDPDARPCDFVRPGHLFPLRYAEGGVLARRGHTEASVDLARIAGCYPAAVICEVMSPDGGMPGRDELLGFAVRHGITAVTVAQIAAFLTPSPHRQP